ncbi:MAG: photosynthetic complex putative assembly protein PuhB [Hyphomicrobiaceae bacterium]|nr:photosynthetic complex putative assembly protein PuhB [Hyphomicrobiaceae bacterium]
MSDHDDFAFEPIPGLPQRPPAGETILWQGAPRWRALAWRGFFVRTVLAYFAVLMAWRMAEALSAGASPLAAFAYAADLAPFALAAIAVLAGLAWAYAGSTIYTVTSRRVVIRSGVALPITVNIPFSLIESAGQRLHADGTGDISLRLATKSNVSRLALWPNIRPWCFTRTEPMLRTIAEPARIAEILARALAASAEEAPARTGQAPASAAPSSKPVRAERPADQRGTADLDSIATAARLGGAH